MNMKVYNHLISAIKKFFPFVLLFLSACTPKKETKNSFADKADEFFSGQMKYHRFNGNVLVAEKGNIIFQKSYGYADFDSGRMLNDSSVFELASVSKQFTAMGILLLMERDKLKLTDSLRHYFPELPYSNITLRHMLTHTSGLPGYESVMTEKWDKTKIAFNSDMIAFLVKEKLPASFSPGTKWEYSNTAYAILASIIEKVSGQTFAAFLAENIFKPLGMRHSRVYNTRRSLKDTIANYAYGYIYKPDTKKYILPDSDSSTNFVVYLDGIQGDGIVNSTTGDLLIWDRALKNHTLLSEATQKEMLKGQELVDTLKKTYYGYGVMVEKTEDGDNITHSGGWPGYVTNLSRNVNADRTIIILSNNSANAPSLSKTMEHLFAGKPVILPYEHKEIILDSAALVKFTGTYEATTKIRLEQKGSKLFRITSSGQSLELKPESATKFFYTDDSDRQIEFELDANNKISKTWLIVNGLKTELKKTE